MRLRYLFRKISGLDKVQNPYDMIVDQMNAKQLGEVCQAWDSYQNAFFKHLALTTAYYITLISAVFWGVSWLLDVTGHLTMTMDDLVLIWEVIIIGFFAICYGFAHAIESAYTGFKNEYLKRLEKSDDAN